MKQTYSGVECIVDSRDQLGETPLWCATTRKLWWIDIEKPKLQSFDPANGRHKIIQMPGQFFGSQALTKSGKRLVAIDCALNMLDLETSVSTPFAQVETGFDNRLNDGRVDAKGRLWIGTMDNQLSRPNGSLYRIDPDGTATKMIDDIIVTNGIAFTPDHQTLFLTDTRRYQTWAFDFDLEDGAISNRRLFADYTDTGDRPDGACVDVDGCLWNAFFAGSRIVRYTPEGKIDRTLEMPVTNPTCLCFGGDDLKTLYVTTASKFLSAEKLEAEPRAGSLFALEGTGQGLPENLFG